MYYLGLDPSLTATGVVIVDDNNNLIVKTEIKTKAGDLPDIPRIDYIVSQIFLYIYKYKPKVITVEGYSFGAKGASLTRVVSLGAILRYRLHKHGKIPVYDVPPTVLKKYVTGKGNSNKEIMILEAYKKWGVEGTNNEIDAYGLAHMAGFLDGILLNTKANVKDLSKNVVKIIDN